MKKRLLILMTVTGMIILLGGLLTYGLGVHEIIPVPRPDLIVVGTSLIGILLIVSGVCDLFVKKTKEMEIEENDERNISLSNAAMASGFKVMNVTIAVSIFALIFTGYMTVVPCFTMMERKLSPNNLSSNNLNQNHLSRESEAPATYGRYENVFLTESEYAELLRDFPDRLDRLISELSSYMESTGRSYQNHAATIRRWAENDKTKGVPKQGIPDYTCKEGESL